MTLLKRILHPLLGHEPACQSCRHWTPGPARFRTGGPLIGSCQLRKSKTTTAYTQAADSCSLHQPKP